jgi:predicted Zn-dependent protease
MSRTRKKKRGLLASFRRWSRRRYERADSLVARRSLFKSNFFRFQNRLNKRLKFFFRNFFRFSAGNPVVVAANAKESRRLKLVHFLNPINWIKWPLGFLFSYFFTRPYLSLGPALYAMIVVAGVITLLIQQGYQGGRVSRAQIYQRLLATSLQAKDYKTALICSLTLTDLLPNDLRFQFERAKLEKELGNEKLSEQLMFRMATQQKYGLAAMHIAESRFKVENLKDWKPEEHQLYRTLMSLALTNSDPQFQDAARVRLSNYLATIGAYSDSLRYLVEVVPTNPQFALPALELASQTKDFIKIESLAPIARDYQQKQLDAAPHNPENRLKLARVLALDQDIDGAIRLIDDGLRLQPSPELQNALGEALVLKGDRLARGKQSPNILVERMQVIHRAATLAPNNPLVVEAIIDIVLQFRNNQNQEIQILREAALQGLNPESVHFVRGTIALLENRRDEAKTHLELAAKNNLQIPGILNNLAVAIASDKNGNLDEALSLSNAALEQLQHPYLYETRGQILFKQGKFSECILDLEKGLQAQELAPAIYPSLVASYKALGNETLADEYATRLADIERQKIESEKSSGN